MCRGASLTAWRKGMNGVSAHQPFRSPGGEHGQDPGLTLACSSEPTIRATHRGKITFMRLKTQNMVVGDDLIECAAPRATRFPGIPPPARLCSGEPFSESQSRATYKKKGCSSFRSCQISRLSAITCSNTCSNLCTCEKAETLPPRPPPCPL